MLQVKIKVGSFLQALQRRRCSRSHERIEADWTAGVPPATPQLPRCSNLAHPVTSYDRLDKQLKDFLNDREQITKISERSVFQVYDQAFSEAELRELIAFYSTTTGQKALQFLPTLSGQVQKLLQANLIPKVQEFITPKIKAETEQLKQRIQERKTKKP